MSLISFLEICSLSLSRYITDKKVRFMSLISFLFLEMCFDIITDRAVGCMSCGCIHLEIFFLGLSIPLLIKLIAFELAAKFSMRRENPFNHVCATRKTQFSNSSKRDFPFCRDLRRPTQMQSALKRSDLCHAI
jgi:hypothetical protein